MKGGSLSRRLEFLIWVRGNASDGRQTLVGQAIHSPARDVLCPNISTKRPHFSRKASGDALRGGVWGLVRPLGPHSRERNRIVRHIKRTRYLLDCAEEWGIGLGAARVGIQITGRGIIACPT